MRNKKLKFVKTAEGLNKDAEIFKQMTFGDTQPSPVDERDFIACVGDIEKTSFPKEYLAPQTEIFNQGVIGSCVAHSCATALAQGEEVLLQRHNEYSRGYIYGNRKPTDAQGEGMIMRQALKQLHNCGDVLYEDFPHNSTYPKVKALIEEQKEELAQKALPHAIIDFYRCFDEYQIKNAIVNAGGVLICVPVYPNFGRDLHTPESTSGFEGYHAMIIVGWTKDNKWVVQNSWGKGWGYDGKLLMDKDYPVSEYWGITVNTDNVSPKPKKKSIWFKLIGFIDWIIDSWKEIFRQIFHKTNK